MTPYEKIAKIQDEVEVRKSADNPFFHSKYATYEGVLNAIHDAMRKYHLVAFHTFEPSLKDGTIVVVITLANTEDGGLLQSKLEIPLLKNDPQSAGSAITYAKRYSLLAILGLGTEDDDGNVSSGKTVYSDPRVQKATGGVIYASDIQLRKISDALKAGILPASVGSEIGSMSNTRAIELIKQLNGVK